MLEHMIYNNMAAFVSTRSLKLRFVFVFLIELLIRIALEKINFIKDRQSCLNHGSGVKGLGFTNSCLIVIWPRDFHAYPGIRHHGFEFCLDC